MSQPQITFYDIASAPPLRSFAPNPWKTRLALNHKKVPYTTSWTQMPHIRSVREKLGIPANRTLPDGSPYHTLPVIHDHNSGALIGDTFEIALYLDRFYPDLPTLFRPNTQGLTAAFNAHVDGLFTKHAALCSVMPFDPEFVDEIHDMFAKRAGMKWEDMQLPASAREGLLVTLEAGLGELAKSFRHTGGTTDWIWRQGGTDKRQKQTAPQEREGKVWLDGDEPTYADFVVGGWLKMMEAALPKDEWEKMRTWQGGMWGRFVDALEPWCEIK